MCVVPLIFLYYYFSRLIVYQSQYITIQWVLNGLYKSFELLNTCIHNFLIVHFNFVTNGKELKIYNLKRKHRHSCISQIKLKFGVIFATIFKGQASVGLDHVHELIRNEHFHQAMRNLDTNEYLSNVSQRHAIQRHLIYCKFSDSPVKRNQYENNFISKLLYRNLTPLYVYVNRTFAIFNRRPYLM